MTVITAAQFKAMLQNGQTITDVQVNELIDIQPADVIANNIDVQGSQLQDIRITGKTIPVVNFFMTKIRGAQLKQCSLNQFNIGAPGAGFQGLEADQQTTITTLNIAGVDPSGSVKFTGATINKINVSDCSVTKFYMVLNPGVSCEWKATNFNCSQVTFGANFSFYQATVSA
jgi:hypothetical protein